MKNLLEYEMKFYCSEFLEHYLINVPFGHAKHWHMQHYYIDSKQQCAWNYTHIHCVVGSGKELDEGYPCQSLCFVACPEARNSYQKKIHELVFVHIKELTEIILTWN